jgi:hypothetical protein
MATMGTFVPAARADEVQMAMYGAVPDTGCAVHPVMAIPLAVKPTVPAGTLGENVCPACGVSVAVNVTEVFNAPVPGGLSVTVTVGVSGVTVYGKDAEVAVL